jgi:hypothetical protein
MESKAGYFKVRGSIYNSIELVFWRIPRVTLDFPLKFGLFLLIFKLLLILRALASVLS